MTPARLGRKYRNEFADSLLLKKHLGPRRRPFCVDNDDIDDNTTDGAIGGSVTRPSNGV